MDWKDRRKEPYLRMEGGGSVSIIENGPLRCTIQISIQYKSSKFVKEISLSHNSEIVDFIERIHWRERGCSLKLALNLKTSELNCVLLNPLSPSELKPLLNRLTEKLNPYLDHELDPTISQIPIKYFPEHQGLKIYFDGENNSKGEILKILIKEFESDFTVISFTQPRTSQLERVYAEMVKYNEPPKNGGT